MDTFGQLAEQMGFTLSQHLVTALNNLKVITSKQTRALIHSKSLDVVVLLHEDDVLISDPFCDCVTLDVQNYQTFLP